MARWYQRFPLLAWAPCLVLLVFWRHWSYLALGFAAGDDQDFFKVLAPLEWRQLAELFSPYWGWFYRPTFLVFFWLQCQLFGSEAVFFHAASLLLHAANAWLLSWLVWRLAPMEVRLPQALLAGAFFVFYPGKEQALFWISSSSALLSAGAMLLCLHYWLSLLQKPSMSRLLLSTVAMAMALGSKEEALAVLPAMLLLQWASPYRGKRPPWAYWLLPLFVALAYVALAYTAFVWSSQHPRFDWVLEPVRYRRLAPWGVLEFYALAFWQQLDVLVQMAGSECAQPACGVYFYSSDLGTAAPAVVLAFAATTLLATGVAVIKLGRTAGGSRAAMFFVGWALLCCTPVPLLAGRYAFVVPWRFFYVPALPVAALWSWLVVAGLCRLMKHLNQAPELVRGTEEKR